MWITCSLCGAIVAAVDLHRTWHAARGDVGAVTDITQPATTPEEH